MFKQKSKKPILIKRALLLTTPIIVVAASFVVYFGRHNMAEAATNSTINFQARLLNAAGSIVPDGNYNVEFKLYNASSSSGSSQGSCSGDSACLWTETRTSSNRVRVVNGYMTVNLGSVTAFGSIDWDQELWLTMNVGGTLVSPSFDGEMTPRLKLTAVPYAFRAGSLIGGSGANTTKLTTGTPSGNNTIALPAESGTVCLQSSTACGFAASTGSTSYINNSTTLQTANFHIQSASATSVGAIIRGAASQTSSLLQMVDGTTGYSVAQFTNNGYLYLGSDNISRTGQIVFQDGTLSNSYTATFTAPAALTASRTITIPDENGTVCLQSSTACGFAASTGSANYIQNQFASAQSTASYWISGTGRAATALQAPLIDAAASGVLAIGTTLATEIDLNQNTVIANNKTLTAKGTALFKPATNATSAFAIQNADASQTLFNADTTNGRIGVGGVATFSKFEVIGGDAAIYNSGGNPRLVLGDSTSAGENGYLQWDSANNYFRIESVGTNGLKINDNYVTIGNIYPSQPLIVANGTTKLFEVNTTGSVFAQTSTNSITGVQVQNAATGVVFDVDTTNSRVGIGNAAPTVDLDVGPLAMATNQLVQTRIGDLLLQSQQGAASGITVSNSRGSNGNLTLDGISGGGVYLSPFTTNNNYLASGGGNIRIGSQVAPSYKLDVTGSVNVSSGSSYKINGTDICTSSGCTASSSSAILNQSSSAQSGNFWLQSATNINTATIQTNATQTADLLQFKSSSGGVVAGVRPSGTIWSAPITDPATDVPSNARLFVQPLANASTAIIARAAAGGAPTGDIIKLQDATGANNLFTVGASGVATFQNTTNSDTAFVVNETGGNSVLRVDTTNQRVAIGLSSGSIPSKLYVATSSTVSLRAKQTGSSDVFQLANGTADLMTVGSTGSTLFKNTTDSTTAFRIQNSSSVNLMNVDTTASQVSFGATGLSVQLNVNGDLNMGTSLETPQGFEGATFVPTSPGTWSTGGNGNWTRTTSVSQEGSASAVGADVADTQTSWLDLNYTFASAGTLSFYWRVSSEDGWDYLVICVDSDATCSLTSGYTYRISGEVPWTQVRLPVSSGAHSFRWLYAKDDSSTSGSDLGWVDNVRFESGTGNINGNSLQLTGASGINLSATSGNILIGASDTTGTLLVLDTKTSSGDPTGMVGAMYYNSSMKSFRCYQDGVWRSCMGGLVYANTTWPTGACNSSNTVANTTSACDFASRYTMPLNTCQVGKVFRVHAAGYLSTSSGTFRIELKKGSTVLNTTGVATISSGMGSTQWQLQGYITCISTTSIDSFATFKYTTYDNDASHRWIEWSMPESGVYPASYGNTTTISSSSEALKLTATWGTANASNSITLRQFVVEEMGP